MSGRKEPCNRWYGAETVLQKARDKISSSATQMGITGLLPFLKNSQEKRHISDFKGKRIGIDGYVWLHRGAFCCAQEICMNNGTNKYLGFCKNRLHMFKEFGVTPVVVLDGQSLPMKSPTDKSRRQKRLLSKRKALEFLLQGHKKKAYEMFQQCTSITPFITLQFIKFLQQEGIEYIVAPYEADAQLAYLEKIGHIDAILTEDSDLLVFGSQTVIFKLDKYGDCVVINRPNFANIAEFAAGFTEERFRRMCILSGCDYLPSMHRMGLKTALKFTFKHESIDVILTRAREENFQVPETYALDFAKAELAFQYQRVYNPVTKALDTLNPLTESVEIPVEDLDNVIGPLLTAELAHGIATGHINTSTLKPHSVHSGLIDPDGLNPELLRRFLASSRLPQEQQLVLLESLIPVPPEFLAEPKFSEKPSLKIELTQTPDTLLKQWSRQRKSLSTATFSSFFPPLKTINSCNVSTTSSAETPQKKDAQPLASKADEQSGLFEKFSFNTSTSLSLKHTSASGAAIQKRQKMESHRVLTEINPESNFISEHYTKKGTIPNCAVIEDIRTKNGNSAIATKENSSQLLDVAISKSPTQSKIFSFFQKDLHSYKHSISLKSSTRVGLCKRKSQ